MRYVAAKEFSTQETILASCTRNFYAAQSVANFTYARSRLRTAKYAADRDIRNLKVFLKRFQKIKTTEVNEYLECIACYKLSTCISGTLALRFCTSKKERLKAARKI
jgi:hypothetical protein